MLVGILVPLGCFAMIVLVVWLGIRSSIREREMANKERMALIEKGVYDFPREEAGINLHRYLFWGLVTFGLGIGLIIGSFIGEKDIIYPGLIFSLPGLGMLLFYIIQSKKEKKERISTNSQEVNTSE